jgi:hypothetical protein
MKFPFEATTRAGDTVTITGHFTGYDRPWCGFYDVELEDAKFKQPLTWNANGTFSRDQTQERALDLIDLPQQT